MELPLLIADSGGTKTDWCFIDKNKKEHYFRTQSYHPSNWSKEFLKEISAFWEERITLIEVPLYFFAAGCLQKEKANELEGMLKAVGFDNVHVQSDLHLAGRALFGDNAGVFAILGTGSVLVDWNGKDVQHISGGKGHLIGDEGSGFYFGKLIYEAYTKGTLSDEQATVFMDKVDVQLLAKKVAENETKYLFADIASKLAENQMMFQTYHKKNIHQFYHSVLENRTPLKLSIVGGYFYHHHRLLQPIFRSLNVKIVDFQYKPIHTFVERMVSSVE